MLGIENNLYIERFLYEYKIELVINEVQIGDEISVEDKVKYEFPEV